MHAVKLCSDATLWGFFVPYTAAESSPGLRKINQPR